MNETAKIMQLNREQSEELINFLYDNREVLIGELMQAIEVLGLPDKQDTAFKKTIKNIIYKRWDWFNEGVQLMMKGDDQCEDCKTVSGWQQCENCPTS